jgi:hypothetical protein
MKRLPVLLPLVFVFQVYAQPDGHINNRFLFKCYENGKFVNKYIFLDVTIVRENKELNASCKMATLDRAWMEKDDKVMSFSIVDVEMSKVKPSSKVDIVGHFISASFSLIFFFGDEQLITIENVAQDGKSFVVHGRGIAKTVLTKPPQLIDIEWRQVDSFTLPNGTVFVPL